jgi:peptidoglycan/LPS O-acetylase OafA/YrhL
MIRPAGSTFAYHPELDGLRAFAMVAIVFFHAGAQGWGSTFIALDLFFVLSGFLVANVVLSEIDATGGFRVRQFYARRVRRLLPAAVVAILATSVLLLLTYSQAERAEFVQHAQAALMYVANWQFVAESRDYFAVDAQASPFMHYWSLSVEEQYYVLFPLLVLLFLKLAPGRRRVLLGGLAVLFAASLAAQVVIGASDPTRAYFGTDTRAFQLLAGAMAAVAVREFATTEEGEVRWPTAGRWIATAGVVGYLVLGTELLSMTNSHRNIVATFLASAIVVGMYAAPRALLTRAASRPVPVYLGKISYGTYLWHWPLVLLIGEYLTVRPAVVALLALVLATALASLSYELLETPIRRARNLNRLGWRVVGAGLAVSVASALVVVDPLLSSDRTPSVVLANDASDRAPELRQQSRLDQELDRPVPDVDVDKVRYDKGPDLRWCSPGAPEDCLVVDGRGPHVVLVGDSHARMHGSALKALAREHGFRLSFSVTPNCPFQADVFQSAGDGFRADCEEAREDFYTRTLPRMEPDVVVLVGAARSKPGWHDEIVGSGGDEARSKKILAQATRRTVRLVHRAGAEAVMLKTSAGTEGWGEKGFDPLDCLTRSKRVRDCVVTQPSSRPAEDAIYEAIAIDDDRAAAVDTTPVYCPDAPACLPVLDGRVVWRNPDHLTADVLEHRRQRLWKLLADTGFFGRR